MSIDLVAVLRIANMPAPRAPANEIGVNEIGMVDHRADATLYHSNDKFSGCDPDEHGLNLRRALGAALDAHDDARGIMCFPDVYEPRARTYASLVDAVSSGGFWAPIVALDHIPLRYAAARPGTPEALVAQLIGVMGRDEAITFDVMSFSSLACTLHAGTDDRFTAAYRQQLDQVVSALGAEFAERYDVSLRQRFEAAKRYQEEAPKRQAEATREIKKMFANLDWRR